MEKTPVQNSATTGKPNKTLFVACFLAITTTSFCFILRALTLPQWGAELGLSNTQIGEIAGVGLWPFAISIVLFSLIIDKVGYKNAMVFAFACHIISAVVTYFADGYTSLYIATFIMALGNGTVEAVTNPAVASMFPREKTRWLNYLHAGWPTGLVLGGIIAMGMGDGTDWRLKLILVVVPAIAYAILMFPQKFPLNERVKAGVTYLQMLKEAGIGGALIIGALIIFQIGAVFGWPTSVNLMVTLVVVGVYGFFVRSFGQPLFVIMLLIMLPLAITELGTDSWVSDLMAPPMAKMGLKAGWILIYTSAIMAVLRMMAGAVIHRIKPLALLAVCSAIAAVGLYLFSVSDGIMILVAATIFGIGKSFFWPTMLGVVAERFPKGGALTLNITGGVGMIGAGILGTVILGFVQDKTVNTRLAEYDSKNNTALHSTYATENKTSIFGDYQAIDAGKLATAPEADKQAVTIVQEEGKKGALKTVAIFPIVMLICYVLLILYFRSKGGYKAVVLENT